MLRQRISDWFRKRYRLSDALLHTETVLRVAGWKYRPFLTAAVMQL